MTTLMKKIMQHLETNLFIQISKNDKPMLKAARKLLEQGVIEPETYLMEESPLWIYYRKSSDVSPAFDSGLVYDQPRELHLSGKKIRLAKAGERLKLIYYYVPLYGTETSAEIADALIARYAEPQSAPAEPYPVWQRLLDEANAGGQLDLLHQEAVVLANLNYQVQNGGFEQWIDNRYIVKIARVQNALSNIHTSTSITVKQLLSGVSRYIDVKLLSKNRGYYLNDSYAGYEDEYLEKCRRANSEYRELKDKLMNDIENYFAGHFPKQDSTSVRQFKVGDKIRVKAGFHHAGNTGSICFKPDRVHWPFDYAVRMDKHDTVLGFNASEIEAYPPVLDEGDLYELWADTPETPVGGEAAWPGLKRRQSAKVVGLAVGQAFLAFRNAHNHSVEYKIHPVVGHWIDMGGQYQMRWFIHDHDYREFDLVDNFAVINDYLTWRSQPELQQADVSYTIIEYPPEHWFNKTLQKIKAGLVEENEYDA